jgi:hypothetical protein
MKILSDNNVPDNTQQQLLTSTLHVINPRHKVQQVGAGVVEIQQILLPSPEYPSFPFKSSTTGHIPNQLHCMLNESVRMPTQNDSGRTKHSGWEELV